ncbi:hypothetical protein ACP70R_018389 [Stipagrostis hirtigluma subsp. patula]
MEAKCASYWSSPREICDDSESEMIAHLQTFFWSSSDVDLDFKLYSSNNCFSLPSSSSFSLTEGKSHATGTTMDMAADHQLDAAKIGTKRKIGMSEQINHGVEAHVTPSAPAGRKRSGKNSQNQYAKQKRRERINEKLKILQQLIPNGTKVDIGTMLEEAVQYVKFLHMQIKLLSSDEMWMSAPLAYDGINIRVPLPVQE